MPDLNDFYKSLRNEAITDLEKNNSSEEYDDDEIIDYQRITSHDENYTHLDNKIEQGHIVHQRGSHMVALARLTDLSLHEITQAEFYKCFSAAMFEGCPTTYAEAMTSQDSQQWKEAIEKEMSQLKKFNTWDIKVKPENVKAVKSKWVFTKKFDKNGQVKKYKARFVAKGYSQKDRSPSNKIN